MNNDLNNCMICKLIIKDKQEIIFCNHCGGSFHKEHLLEWLSTNNTCPVCKGQLEQIVDKDPIEIARKFRIKILSDELNNLIAESIDYNVITSKERAIALIFKEKIDKKKFRSLDKMLKSKIFKKIITDYPILEMYILENSYRGYYDNGWIDRPCVTVKGCTPENARLYLSEKIKKIIKKIEKIEKESSTTK